MGVLESIREVMSNKWVFSLVTVIVFYLIAKLVHLFCVKYLLVWAKRTKTKLDDMIIGATNNLVSLLIFTAGVRLAIIKLALNYLVYYVLTRIIYSTAIVIVTLIIIIILRIIIDEWGRSIAQRTKSEIHDEVLPLIHSFAKVTLWIIAFLIILSTWGVEIGPLLASLGIAGIAIGFAVKDSLANIFGGVSLILDKNIRVGDTVKIENETGKILEIGLRSTRIRTWDNEVKIIPNGILANTTLVNYAQPDPSARLTLPFAVEYGSNPAKVRKVVLAAIKKLPIVLEEPPPFVRFHEMGDFSLNFKAYFWVTKYGERFEAKDRAVDAIYEVLNKHGIGIPFPTRTLYMLKGKKKR